MLTEEQKKRREAADAAEAYVVEAINALCRDTNTLSIGNMYSRIDGLLMERRTNRVIGVYEIKCRNISFADVVRKFNCELIVDKHKLESLKAASSVLRCPSYLFTYLMGDGVIYRSPITDEYGDWVCLKREQVTTAPLLLGGDAALKEMSQIKLDGGTVLGTHKQVGTI